jgi:hypothetical protein
MLPFAAVERSMSDRLLTLESRQVSGLLFPYNPSSFLWPLTEVLRAVHLLSASNRKTKACPPLTSPNLC